MTVGRRPGPGRPPLADPTHVVGVRLPVSVLARLDALLDRGEGRSAFIRAAIEAALVDRESAR